MSYQFEIGCASAISNFTFVIISSFRQKNRSFIPFFRSMLLIVLYLQKKEVETISIIIMEQIVLSLKQLSDNKWMDALSDDRQYMFVIRPKKVTHILPISL